ncbi:MAG: hypothetical protein FWE48_03430 [Coriobacteriia bacterium]|nr:hypothetical protein [Coriobacteriia bacterium]
MANAKNANSQLADASTEGSTNKKREIRVKGITLHVWDDILDDLELLEDLIALDEGDNRASISALKRVLGDEYSKIKDALRDERGIVKTKDVGAFFFAVLDEVRAKNF